MEERIKNYLAYIDEIIEQNKENTENIINEDNISQECRKKKEDILENHLRHISFYQHERIVHLIVTVLFAILTFMAAGIAIIADYLYMYLVMAALMVLLIPYIKHYYYLENSVQKMYDQYRELLYCHFQK